MSVINETLKFGKDAIQGAWDTIIVAPFKFGMFLGNLSGLAGKQQQIKAELEWKFAKKAALAFWNNTGGARDYILKEIGEDAEKKPGYYIGSLGAGLTIKAPSTVVKIGEKAIDFGPLKTATGKMTVYGGKADMLINDMYNKFLETMSKQQIFQPGSDLKDIIDKNFYNYLNGYGSPYLLPELYDPLTLDLNNDGKISTLNLGDGVYFDHNKDGVAFKSSWIGKEDGILVFDKNNNGLIDNGNELFGNHTISNTSFKYTDDKATNGYEALKAYDLNGDNVIDSKDEIYNNTLLWKYDN